MPGRLLPRPCAGKAETLAIFSCPGDASLMASSVTTEKTLVCVFPAEHNCTVAVTLDWPNMCNYPVIWRRLGRKAEYGDRSGRRVYGPVASVALGLARAIEKEHTRIWRTESRVRRASTMRKTLSATAVLIGAMALLGTSPARAVTLLSLLNSPATTGTPYNLFFTATAPTTTISVGGYDDPAFEYVFDLSVKRDGGPNLLGESWVFTPARSGSEATEFDGLLKFGDISVGNYDTFSQTFATIPDDTYLLSFQFANSIDGSSFPSDPNGLLVTTSGGLASIVAVPEPATWMMALLGFVGLGLVGYRRGRTIRSRTRAA